MPYSLLIRPASFKLDDQIDMKFEADKDEEGNFKQHLLDDSMVVKKGTDRLTVKIFPN